MGLSIYKTLIFIFTNLPFQQCKTSLLLDSRQIPKSPLSDFPSQHGHCENSGRWSTCTLNKKHFRYCNKSICSKYAQLMLSLLCTLRKNISILSSGLQRTEIRKLGGLSTTQRLMYSPQPVEKFEAQLCQSPIRKKSLLPNHETDKKFWISRVEILPLTHT